MQFKSILTGMIISIDPSAFWLTVSPLHALVLQQKFKTKQPYTLTGGEGHEP